MENFDVWEMDSIIDREWAPYLSDTEYRIVRFIFQRTCKFKKGVEWIPEKHFLEGVFDRQGAKVQGHLPVSGRTLYRNLQSLVDNGFVIRLRKNRNYPTQYSLNKLADLSRMAGRTCHGRQVGTVTDGRSIKEQGNNNMRIRTGSGKAPADIEGDLAGVSKRAQDKRSATKAKGNARGWEKAWEDAFKEFHGAENLIGWTKTHRSQIRVCLNRLPKTANKVAFIEFVVEHWSTIISSHFSWMKRKPTYPILSFLVKNFDAVFDAYSTFDKIGELPTQTSAKSSSGEPSASMRAEMKALREQNAMLKAERDDARRKAVKPKRVRKRVLKTSMDDNRDKHLVSGMPKWD